LEEKKSKSKNPSFIFSLVLIFEDLLGEKKGGEIYGEAK